MLEVKNITKYFGEKLVLENVSFKIPKGKIYGLIGPNGAGKTTTLRIILNILLPSSGEVLVNNEKMGEEFLNFTGYLPEERGLYPKSKVKNILNYLGQLKGLTKKECDERITYWLSRLDLNHSKNYLLEELSKGNQQKIQFISAILHDPKILILDEPFSGFDPVNQSIFRDIIEELKPEKYIILSTHLMDLAESLCDDICLINNGKKIIEGNLEEVLGRSKQNLYEVQFSHSPSSIDFSKFESVNIMAENDNSVIINLNNNEPEKFINVLSSEYSISEFRKINPSLHQLFLSLIKSE